MNTNGRMRQLITIFCCLGPCVAAFASAAPAAPAVLEWGELPPLPGTVGLAGAFVGVDNGALIVAGGANFSPDAPWSPDANQRGPKVWHDRIYVLPAGADEWDTRFKLDKPTAYGKAVATDDGLLLIGGCGEGDRPYDDVTLVSWDRQARTLTQEEHSTLPAPSARLGAGRIGGKVYVLPGHRLPDKTDVPRELWSLDLAKPPAERKWQIAATPCPGGARLNPATAVQTAGGAAKYWYVFGGVVFEMGPDAAAGRRFLKDVYRFDPRAAGRGQAPWKRLADIPVETAAACATDLGPADVLLFGGVNGQITSLPPAERPDNPRTVRCYHAIVDRWTDAGATPVGVVCTAAVRRDGRIVLPTGEVRPGIRTPKVQAGEPAGQEDSFGAVNVAVLVGYLVLLVAMGVYFSRREKSTDDYFLAGKRIPWWAAGISIFGTQLSAISFLGMPAVAYSTDWMIFPGKLAALLIFPIVIFLYLPFFRRLNVTTAYEYLERRFNVWVRLYGSASFVAFQVVRMAIVVYLPALALSAVTGINVYVCILVMGVLATLYTVLGGMEAVIWTDVLQLVVLSGGILIALVLILVETGGPAAVYETALADGKLRMAEWTWDHTSLATWSILVGTFALQFGPFTTDQAVIQRYLTTKSEKAAARSIVLSGSMALPWGILITVLGTCLYVFFKNNPELLTAGMKNDAVLPLFVAKKLPPGVSGLIIAGVFAAAMSTLDSSMHSIATAVTTDWYRRFRPNVPDHKCLTVARIITVVAGLSGMAVAMALATFDIKSLFLYFQKMLGLISSSLVGVFMLGIFTRRANWSGVLIGAAAGVASLVYLVFFTATHFYVYAIVGILVCVGVGYLASLLLPIPPKDLSGLTIHTRKKANAS